MGLWNIFRKKQDSGKQIPEDLITEEPLFDNNIKVVVPYEISYNYAEILYWIDSNSKGLVSVKQTDKSKVFIGFENEDDALYFKIKFL